MNDENKWWDDLTGEDVERNAYGCPHYDASAVADFIENHIQGPTVLDLGCGPGRLGHLIAERNRSWNLIGIDVSPNMISRSLEDAPDNWTARANDGSTLGIVRINSAYSVTVLQHLPAETVVSYVQQVYDALERAGVFIFTYAVGEEDTFLSHQTSHDDVIAMLHGAGFRTYRRLQTPADHPAWNWAVGIK